MQTAIFAGLELDKNNKIKPTIEMYVGMRAYMFSCHAHSHSHPPTHPPTHTGISARPKPLTSVSCKF